MKKKQLLVLSLLMLSPMLLTACDKKESDDTSISQEAADVEITLTYGEDLEEEKLTLKEGETLSLKEYSYKYAGYDVISWSDGTNTYGPEEEITVKKGLHLTASLQKYNSTFVLSKDGTHYIYFRYRGEEEETSVPTSYHGIPVTEISEKAFQAGKSLKKITIGDHITTIGSSIFKGLNNLEEVTLPFLGEAKDDSESTVGRLFGLSIIEIASMPASFKKITLTKQDILPSKAFEDCSSIEEVHLLGTTKISSYAFSNMPALRTIELGEGLKETESQAFNNLDSLESLTLPSSLETFTNSISGTKISSLHFGKSLKKYEYRNLNSSLKEISVDPENPNFSSENDILFNKDKTTLITYPSGKEGDDYTLPSTVTTIGNCAFMGAKLAHIDLSNVKVLEDEAFRSSHLEEIAFPSSLIRMGQTVFSDTHHLTKVTFSSEINGADTLSMGRFTFSSSTALKELTIPSYVKDIPAYFSPTSLEKITFLGSLKSIGDLAFAGTQLTEIETTFDDNATIGERIFNNSGSLSTWKLHFVTGVKNMPTLSEKGFGSFLPAIVCDSEDIVTALKEKWPDVASQIGLEKVSPFVIEDGKLTKFNGDETDVDVVIPEGVTRIGHDCFAKNKFIRSVTLPSTLEGIEQRAFDNCSGLHYVVFTNDDPSNIKSYYVQNGVADRVSDLNLGDDFLYLTNNRETKEKLKSTVFSALRYLVLSKDEVDIHDGYILSNDGKTLIKDYRSRKNYSLPSKNITSLYDYCFAHDNEMNVFDFTGIQSIGEDAFYSSRLESIALPKSVTNVGKEAFGSLDYCTSITIEGAAALGESAFTSDYYLESIDLGEELVSIGSLAFQEISEEVNDGDGLEELVIPASVQDIAEDAFEDAYIQKITCNFTRAYAEETFSSGLGFLDDADNVGEFVFLGE